MKDFDEEDALKYMRKSLGEHSTQFTDDDLYFILDAIWDFYDDNGYLDLSDTDSDSDECGLDEILAYVVKALKKDKESTAKSEDAVLAAIKGELDYEKDLEKDF